MLWCLCIQFLPAFLWNLLLRRQVAMFYWVLAIQYPTPDTYLPSIIPDGEIKKSVLEIFQSSGCLRIQSLTSNYSFQFSFPQSVPALVTRMNAISIPIAGCAIDVISLSHFVYELDSFYNKILTTSSIDVNCTKWSSGIRSIEINLLPPVCNHDTVLVSKWYGGLMIKMPAIFASLFIFILTIICPELNPTFLLIYE